MSDLTDYYVEDINDTNKYLDKIMRSGLAKFPPLIITCAITGGNQGKESNPNLPEEPAEQVQQAYDAYNAGAAMVHIHGRGPQPELMGYNTMDSDVYRKLNYMVREKCPDLIVNNTAICGRWWTADGGMQEPTMPSVVAKPEVASIDVTNYFATLLKRKRPAPLQGIDEDYINELGYGIAIKDVNESLAAMAENGVKPEFEMFGIQDLHYVRDLAKANQVDAPYWCSMIFGNIFNYPTPEVLRQVMNILPEKSMLNVITTGPAQFPFITLAMIMGCHVRVGMEDNFYIGKGQLAESNAQLVEKVVRIANELGRPIATPAQAREMLGLGEPRQYEKP